MYVSHGSQLLMSHELLHSAIDKSINSDLALFWADDIRTAAVTANVRRLFLSEFCDLRLFALLCDHNNLGLCRIFFAKIISPAISSSTL